MGAVSFLSTVPSFVSLSSPTATATATATTAATASFKYPPILPVTVRCKLEADVADDDQLRRRDILKCFGATIAMEIIASNWSFPEEANAADLIQRRQRSEFQSNIKGTLATAIKGNPDLVPSILTLALNDAMTYDKATKCGGSNGSIRFSSEINRLENKGLSAALSFLEEAKKEIDSYSLGGPISYADLIQCAAQSAVKSTFLAAAIRKCGGKEEKGSRLYAAYGSSGQVSLMNEDLCHGFDISRPQSQNLVFQLMFTIKSYWVEMVLCLQWGLFDRQFGRSDSQEADPEGRVPLWEKASVEEMKDKFVAVGLTPRQLAVMSAFLGPDQVATEALLAADPDVAPWVLKYQRSRETVSQTDYEVDLITALTKLCSLGQQINYEAYTYPVQKLDLSKLKL